MSSKTAKNSIAPTPYNSPENAHLSPERLVCRECDKDGCLNCYDYGIFCLNCRYNCSGKLLMTMKWEYFSANTYCYHAKNYEEFLKKNKSVYKQSPIIDGILISSEKN